jgi:hypothetical protein
MRGPGRPATLLDDVQLFGALATTTSARGRALGESGCAGERGGRDVSVVVDLDLVRVASRRSLTQRLHGVLVAQAEDGLAFGVGAAGES